MVSKLNTEPFSTRQTCNISGPSPPKSPTPSSAATCNPNTPILSFSYAPPVLPNTSLSRQSVPNPLSIESIDEQLQTLLKHKLVYRVIKGRPADTLEFHCHQLVEELTRWILPHRIVPNSYDGRHRDRLVTLLSSTCKQNAKNVPVDQSEWLKLLNQWIRSVSTDDTIYGRDVYEIMAVDGFYGFRPKDLKQYLSGVLYPLKSDFYRHAKGVRAMYAHFDRTPRIASLTGTDSACVVFLSLLDAYSKIMKQKLLDDQLHFQVLQAKSWAEGFLHKHSEYYRDLNHVDDECFKTLAHVYNDHFTEKSQQENVGNEMLKQLNGLCNQILK